MLFKKNKKICPTCGTKNDKERMVCIKCGALLASAQVGERLTEVPPEGKPNLASKKESLFHGIGEVLRDKTRDKVCAHLCAIGLDAGMVERGRPEERITLLIGGKSLGLIEIHGKAIHYVSMRKFQGQDSVGYSNECLVPDPKVPTEGYLELKSVRVKSAPLFGRVVDLRWEAKFVKVKSPFISESIPVSMESNLIRQMNEDISLKESLIRLKENVKIRSFPHWGWVILTSHNFTDQRRQEEWDCYEIIARYLLETAESEGTGTAK